jgi:hypothetical protein
MSAERRVVSWPVFGLVLLSLLGGAFLVGRASAASYSDWTRPSRYHRVSGYDGSPMHVVIRCTDADGNPAWAEDSLAHLRMTRYVPGRVVVYRCRRAGY